MARLPKNDKVVDIGTIAAALGVSKTTVSRAISGNGRVGAATRQRVQDYVKEHNYTPSVMARGLAMRCSYNISLVISKQFSDFEMPFLRKTMRSVYQAAEDCDYDVLLTLVGENETRPVERLLDNRKIDGLILTRTLERDPLIPLLKSRKLPFVAIGRPEDPTVMSVDHDQVGGCRELTSLLLMKGMKRIALLGGTMLYTVNMSRLEGFKQAYDMMDQKNRRESAVFGVGNRRPADAGREPGVGAQAGLYPVHGRPADPAGDEYAQAAGCAGAAGYPRGVAV